MLVYLEKRSRKSGDQESGKLQQQPCFFFVLIQVRCSTPCLTEVSLLLIVLYHITMPHSDPIRLCSALIKRTNGLGVLGLPRLDVLGLPS